MSKYFMFIICALFILLTALPVMAAAQPGDSDYHGLRVQGRYLYDYMGNKVTLIGVNAMVIYWDDGGRKSFSNIEKTGANAARIFWNVDDNIPISKFDTTIGNSINHQLIPIPGLWNATGKWEELDKCVDWWLQDDVVKIIKKYEKYIIVNIANEAGANVPKDEWEAKYKEIITRFREAGIRVPLMIDAANWGRGENYLLEKGPSLVEHDPEHNLIFSWHVWDENQPRSRYTKAFQSAVDKDLCMIVGEFSHVGVFYDKPITWETMLEECAKFDIGWLPWSWRGAGEDDGHNMTVGYDYNNLTEFGSKIVPFIEKNAVRTLDFPEVQAPTAPQNLTFKTTNKNVLLQWEPSTDDTQVQEYEVYRNGTMIKATGKTQYADLGLETGETYSYYVKAADPEGNLSEQSNTVEITIEDPDQTGPAEEPSTPPEKQPEEKEDEETGSRAGSAPFLLIVAALASVVTLIVIYARKRKQ